jgi:hypothetical protein
MESNASNADAPPPAVTPAILDYRKPEPSPPVAWFILFWIVGSTIGAFACFLVTVMIIFGSGNIDGPPRKSDASDWAFAVSYVVVGVGALAGFTWRIFQRRRLSLRDRWHGSRGFSSGFLFGLGALTTFVGVMSLCDAWAHR